MAYSSRRLRTSALGLVLCAVPFSALAQSDEPATDAAVAESTTVADDQDAEVRLGTVVVEGERRQEGESLSEIEPDLVFTRDDIESFGASTFAEVLEIIAQETSSGRGQTAGPPVVLINGRRVVGFRALRAYPSEAIARVEVLPEEAALSYGFRADQRVINFVLVDELLSLTLEQELGGPTDGGQLQTETETSALRLKDGNRTSFDIQITHNDALLESERDIILEDPVLPFDILGNVTAPVAGDEIDPALSALIGSTVTEIAVPATATGGPASLNDFAAAGSALNMTDLTPFRSLISDELNISANLAQTWNSKNNIETTVSIGGDYTERLRFTGLPEADLILPEDNPFSPFDEDVSVFRLVDEDGPQTQSTEIYQGTGSFAVVSAPGRQAWTFTGSYDFTATETLTEGNLQTDLIQIALDAGSPEINPFGPLGDLAGLDVITNRAEIGVGQLDFISNNKFLELPGGDLSTTLQLGFRTRDQDSFTDQGGIEQDVSLSRDEGNLLFNVDAPIYRHETDKFPGRLSLNGNFELNQLSDFGTLITYGYGVRWQPIEQLRFRFSLTEEENAPGIGALGNPIIVTPNSRVFDFTTGETVFVDRITGGNPDLLAEERRIFSIATTYRPDWFEGSTLTVTYNDSKIDNPIRGFPALTAEVEAAFPERFERDLDGNLISIDTRSISFQREDRRELRTQFNFRKRIGRRGRGGPPPGARGGRPGGPPGARGGRPQGAQGGRPPGARGGPPAGVQGGPPPGASGRPAAGAPPQQGQPPAQPGDPQQAAPQGQATGRPQGQGRPGGPPNGRPANAQGRPGGPPGGRGRRRGGGRPGSWDLSLTHIWRIEETLFIADGIDPLDFLNGSALGSGGGRPGHTVQLRAGFFNKGLGARLSGRWQSATSVLGGTDDPASNLEFDSLATFDLTFFANLGDRPKLQKYDWLQDTRVRLSIDNILNIRQDVVDGTGITPINFQQNLIDPLGRTIEISIRKRF